MAHKKASTEFQCTACGGASQFDPALQSLKCMHCGTPTAISDAPWSQAQAQKELCFDTALQTTRTPTPDITIAVIDCSSCGAELTFDTDTGGTTCPFCASAIVRGARDAPALRPQSVLPFTLSSDHARAIIEKWLSSRWFLPSKLKSFSKRQNTFRGVYAPFWTFDAQTETDYTGQRGDAYYVRRTRMVNGKMQSHSERRIRWSARTGRVWFFFNDILCLGSRHLPQELMSDLQTWDLDKLRLYNPAYLAGFSSELYSIPIAQSFDEAKAQMSPRIHRMVRRDIGGDEQRIAHLATRYHDVTYKHILLPLWIAAYRYNGKVYDVIINGQTGEIAGKRPYSLVKIAGAVILVAAIVGGAMAYGYANDWFETP